MPFFSINFDRMKRRKKQSSKGGKDRFETNSEVEESPSEVETPSEEAAPEDEPQRSEDSKQGNEDQQAHEDEVVTQPLEMNR